MPSVKNCPPEKIYNPDSKRCVLKTGKIGKAILAGTDIHSTKKDVGIKPHQKKGEKSKNVCSRMLILELMSHFPCRHDRPPFFTKYSQGAPNAIFTDI